MPECGKGGRNLGNSGISLRGIPANIKLETQRETMMTKRMTMLVAGVVTAMAAWGQTDAQAVDVIIYANQGAASGIRDLAAGYEKTTGNKVVIVTTQGAALMDKINGNEPGDVVTGFLP